MLVPRISVTCIVGVAMPGCLLPALPAAAADVSGSVAITTDYIYRGMSQTDGQPAAQAGVQFHSSAGWNAGMWGSSVDFQNGSGIAYELDLQAGYAWQLSPDWSMQLGYVHYAYLNDNESGYDYDEVSASVSYQQRATASVSWSPEHLQAHLLGIRLGPAGVRVRALAAAAVASTLVGLRGRRLLRSARSR